MNDKTKPDAPSGNTLAKPPIIRPTVGRVVWYWRDPATYPDIRDRKNLDTQPMAATIAYVHNEASVNLHVIDHQGVPCSATSVPLRQAGEGVPNCSFCEWMPYQHGQAARADAAESAGKPS